MTQKAECVFLDRISIDRDDLDLSALQSLTRLTLYEHCDPDQVVERSHNAEIIIVNKVRLGEQQLKQLTQLKLVCVIATGTNNIDIPAATRLGIRVCNVKDYAAASVSQHVFMLILALYTRFLDYQDDINQGKWQAQDQFCLLDYPMQELYGKTIGLVGYGHIAQAVERLAIAFGMKVLIAQSLRHEAVEQTDRVPLDTLLSQSDVVSLHCPLTELSENLITKKQFEMMKASSIIINTARGGIINEGDLLDALNNKSIAGAGIDCLTTEPPDISDPMMMAKLPQLIVTPHNAWGTIQARQRLVDGSVANIKAYLENTLDKPGGIQALN